MATMAAERGGLMAFVGEALALLGSRRLLAPALVLAVLLTVSNIVIASNLPGEGNRPGAVFAVAAFVRVAGLLVLAVAILRLMTQSPRRPFLPDAGFWLYALTFLAGIAATAAVRSVAGLGESIGALAIGNAAVAVLLAPLAVWFAALAVARPVPWSPAPWLRGLRLWLPHFIFWTLAVVTPLAVLHATIDVNVIRGDREWFWPLMLFDGALSAVMALFGIALIAAAYRRVAQR
jgi:hypothetical protein